MAHTSCVEEAKQALFTAPFRSVDTLGIACGSVGPQLSPVAAARGFAHVTLAKQGPPGSLCGHFSAIRQFRGSDGRSSRPVQSAAHRSACPSNKRAAVRQLPQYTGAATCPAAAATAPAAGMCLLGPQS